MKEAVAEHTNGVFPSGYCLNQVFHVVQHFFSLFRSSFLPPSLLSLLQLVNDL